MRSCGWLLLGLVLVPAVAGARSPIKSDEEVVFFTTFAQRVADAWEVPIHGWIFEPEEHSHWRLELIDSIAEILDMEASPAERALFEKRMHWFLVDNERGKRVPVRIGGQVFKLASSRHNGHFQSAITIPAAALGAEDGAFVRFQAVTRRGDRRKFGGRFQLVGPTGTLVISDIDDTIKVTEVLNRRAMVKNTFYLPFRAVPGMAAAYRKWAEQGAVVFYLSASPWQLWPALEAFMEESGFPPGAVSLRYFRIKDASIKRFLSSSAGYKTETIERLLKRFPERRFVLVGDSGEKDPMIYGDIYRRYPKRIRHIFIRKVPGSMLTPERWAKDFEGVPAKRWTLFADPAKLADLEL